MTALPIRAPQQAPNEDPHLRGAGANPRGRYQLPVPPRDSTGRPLALYVNETPVWCGGQPALLDSLSTAPGPAAPCTNA